MTKTKTTVRELIEKLKEFDGDMNIVLPQHDGGYNDIKGIAYNIHIQRNFYNSDLYVNRSKGEHRMSDNGDYVLVIE